MLKRANYFLAFIFLLFGCATQTTYPSRPSPAPPPRPEPAVSELKPAEEFRPEKEEVKADKPKEEGVVSKLEIPKKIPLLPDIAVTGLVLDQKRRLVVTVANMGDQPLPLGKGNLKVFVDGELKKIYGLNRLSHQAVLQPGEVIPFMTSFQITGRHEIQASIETGREVEELSKENNELKKFLEGLPLGPDIVIRDFTLSDDFELSIVLSNGGEVDLRKGITLRIRILVNGRKVSEFEHFTSDALKAHSSNDYLINPPYPIGLTGTSRVKISVAPRLSSHDILLENNSLERTVSILPFKISAQEKEEFSFSYPLSRTGKVNPPGKVKAEVRWDGGGAPLMLSVRGPGNAKDFPPVSGRSPLKAEFPIYSEGGPEEISWKVWVTNLMEKKADGHLIIQHR